MQFPTFHYLAASFWENLDILDFSICILLFSPVGIESGLQNMKYEDTIYTSKQEKREENHWGYQMN